MAFVHPSKALVHVLAGNVYLSNKQQVFVTMSTWVRNITAVSVASLSNIFLFKIMPY